MDWMTQAKEAQHRAISVFTARPGQGLSTQRGAAVLRDGLHCTYEQDGQLVQVDMPAALGGDGSAPTPGFFGRAAICSCVAIGIRMMALREDLAIETVKVSIDQDWDNRGLFGMEGANPAPLDTRISIEVDSPASPAAIRALVARAVASDPWLLAFRDAQAIRVTHLGAADGR